MLAKIRWILKVLLALLVLAAFHYNLPQRDIVRITGTEILRKDLSGWTGMFYAAAQSGEAQTQNRDLRLINAVRANGKVSVYRNEDTGFNWPPYFKFDSSNLQAEAEDAVSNKEAPEWYILRHYGWRNTFWSIYPNAVSLKPISGPDVRLIPWFNIVFLLVLAALSWAIYVRVRGFWARRVLLNLVGAAPAVQSRKSTCTRTGWTGSKGRLLDLILWLCRPATYELALFLPGACQLRCIVTKFCTYFVG